MNKLKRILTLITFPLLLIGIVLICFNTTNTIGVTVFYIGFILIIIDAMLEVYFNKTKNKFGRISFEQFCKDFPIYDCLYEDIKLPKRATKGSAGYDFFSPIDFTLKVGETIKIPTGLRIRLDDNAVLLCFPRSGHGFKYRLQLDNTVGIIDSDYYNSENEGHIMLKITNDGREGKTLEIKKGQAFAQGIIMKYGLTVDDKSNGIRNGGFGSSDKSNL